MGGPLIHSLIQNNTHTHTHRVQRDDADWAAAIQPFILFSSFSSHHVSPILTWLFSSHLFILPLFSLYLFSLSVLLLSSLLSFNLFCFLISFFTSSLLFSLLIQRDVIALTSVYVPKSRSCSDVCACVSRCTIVVTAPLFSSVSCTLQLQ